MDSLSRVHRMHDITDFRQPSFTKFEHNMLIGFTMNPFGTEFWKLSRNGLFFLNSNFFNVLRLQATKKGKGKGFPYSIPSVGSRADPGVRAVSPQVTASRPPGGRLPLLSARPAVTSPTSEHHRPLVGTKLYCLVTEAHRCKQLAQGCYAASPREGFELAICWSQVQTPYPLHHRATAGHQVDLELLCRPP